jgi:ADP-heptose:LPS heptosyltransferase
MARLSAIPPRRILVLKPCCLGDLVQTTALIAAVHKRWPLAIITIGTGRWSTPAVAHHPAVGHVLDVGALGLRGKRQVGDVVRLWPVLRGRHFDLAIVPDRSPVPALLLTLAGIPVRAGYDSGGRGRCYSIRVRPQPALHELDQMRRLLSALGIEGMPRPRVYPGQQGVDEARALLAALGIAPPLALLAPGGGDNPGTTMPGKRWGPNGFAEVAAALQAVGATVALVGAGGDRAATAAVAAMAPAICDVTARTSVAGVAALAAQASVFVGNDSGVTHLAAAAGCPTVAIFGPTAPGLYAPRGDWVRTVAAPAGVRTGGDGSVRRPYTFRQPWQDTIEPATVVEAAMDGFRAGRRATP